MAQIIDILFRNYGSYVGTIVVVLFVILLIVLSVWCYYNYAKPAFSSNATNWGDVTNNGTNQTVSIYFFNVDWCPHCVKAKPEWIKFCQRYDGKEYNGYMIECVGGKNGTDCTDSDNADITELIQNFNIEHYPTLKMRKGGTVIDFDGKITDDNLETFLSKVLN